MSTPSDKPTRRGPKVKFPVKRQMFHVGAKVDAELYAEVQKHPEINWSEVVRQAVVAKVARLNSSGK